MFLPTTPEEVKNLGWKGLDVILVTGDSYIDSPYIGIAVIGNLLLSKGYRVGIIAQPDVSDGKDITRLGEPELFWGVSGGSVDSMVANYTATKKRRKQDDFTPGGSNNKRPDRAVISYCNLIRRNFKETSPIVLGGIEASLRRVTHYDFWSDSLRRPILSDAKADYLVYGMGEKSMLDLAKKLKQGKLGDSVKGVTYLSDRPNYKYLELPSYEECLESKENFTEMFHLFYRNNDPITAKGLYQKVGNRYIVQNPPQPSPTEEEIDSYYELDYEREVHPYYAKQGKVRAQDTIRYSVTTHRGCYGECNFCAIAVHQGRRIISRSERSILSEVKSFTKDKKFKGNISDVGGPTANMYGYDCTKKISKGACDDKRCLFPEKCNAMKLDHRKQINLLRDIEKVEGVKKVFVASGIRYDLVASDKVSGLPYLKKVAKDHTSGQMKIAPEHSEEKVLRLMGKPGRKSLEDFKNMFYKYSKEAGKNQFLTYYLIAAHPGCEDKEMSRLKAFASEKLSVSPEQVQIFTPTPSTYSTLVYYTGKNPFTGEKLFVEKEIAGKERQKSIIVSSERREFTPKRSCVKHFAKPAKGKRGNGSRGR